MVGFRVLCRGLLILMQIEGLIMRVDFAIMETATNPVLLGWIRLKKLKSLTAIASKVERDKLNDFANSSVCFSLEGADLPMHWCVKSPWKAFIMPCSNCCVSQRFVWRVRFEKKCYHFF